MTNETKIRLYENAIRIAEAQTFKICKDETDTFEREIRTNYEKGIIDYKEFCEMANHMKKIYSSRIYVLNKMKGKGIRNA